MQYRVIRWHRDGTATMYRPCRTIEHARYMRKKLIKEFPQDAVSITQHKE